MAEARKRRKARPGNKPASRRQPAKEVKRGSGTSDERKCWLCSRPLAAGMVASILGPGMFEVHQRCYEQAMRS